MLERIRLSELEQEIMNILWKRNRATAADVQSDLIALRPLKDSTIRTVLTRLEEKGFARHELEGRTFVYSGTERPARVAARAVQQIVDRLCHGSLESLLVGMVDSEIVDADELQKIALRLGQNAPKTRVSSKPRKD